jgi:hypothetical protein
MVGGAPGDLKAAMQKVDIVVMDRMAVSVM